MNGMMLTGRQSTELFAAVNLVQTMKRMLQGIEHEGTEREHHLDMAGVGELVKIVGGKLESTVCANEQEETESRMEMGMLSSLICQLQRVHAEYGDLKVFDLNLEPIQHLEVCVTDPEAEIHLYGVRYLTMGKEWKE